MPAGVICGLTTIPAFRYTYILSADISDSILIQ